MDMSFANQALAAEYLVQNAGKLANQVITLPEALDVRTRRGFHIPRSHAGVQRFRGPRLRPGAGCPWADNRGENTASNQE